MGMKIVETTPTPREVYNYKIYLTSIVIAFGACLFGYCASFIGTTITTTAFKNDFGLATLSTAERSKVSSVIVSIFQAGAFFGSIAGYISMENLGRKRSLQMTSLIFLVSAILQVAATNSLSMIYAGRVIAGFSVGIITTVCPVYLAEISPAAIRGRLVGFYEIGYQIMAVVGFWINYGIKLHMSPTAKAVWRIPMAIQLVPGGLLFLGTFYLVESPRYLLKMSKPELAAKNLSWLRGLPASDPFVEQELSATVVQINREREVTFGQKGNNAFTRYCRGMWHEISAPGIRNRIVIGFCIMMWQNMSGINAINFYSPTLFADIGISDTSLYTGIYGVLKALASIVFFLFIVDTLGRRQPLMWGAVASGLSLLYVAIYIKIGHPAGEAVISASTAAGGKGATAFIMLFSIFYCFGWNGLAWVICAEIYPTRIRGFCSMLTSCAQWLWQWIITYTTPLMSANLGWAMFLLFALCNIVSAVYVYFFIPETKGRSLEDMDSIFGYVHPDEKPEKQETVVQREDVRALDFESAAAKEVANKV